MSRIITRDTEGRENGWLIPVWNSLEAPNLRPDQVYVTSVAPGCRKGPHLHMMRRGYFFVVSGIAGARLSADSIDYRDFALTPGMLFHVQPGTACAFYNYSARTNAVLINMPSPAWSPTQPDEWPVTKWKDPEDWFDKGRRYASGGFIEKA